MKNEETARMEIRRLLEETSVEAPPEATIRGNGNIINSRVTVSSARSGGPALRPPRRGELWRRELLEAVRSKAARLLLTEDQVCESAARDLRKKVVVLSLGRLQADDLARVYEALSARKRPARARTLNK